MRLFSVIAYIITAILLCFSLKMTTGEHFNVMYYWDLASIVFLIGAFVLALVNFKFAEIVAAVKDGLRSTVPVNEKLVYHKNIIQTLWKYLLSFSLLLNGIVLVIIFSNPDTSKIGASLAIMLITPLYALLIKFFILLPLEISIEKKLLLQKKSV